MQRFKNITGFTLVELAIVITIIGLLIGGVLKGQELLENSRMTSTQSALKSHTAAVITFKDIYKALPGDMVNPGNFIQNCTTAPCNVSGNNNGFIGTNDSMYSSDENNNFWLHMAKAGLTSGVNPNATWTSTTRYAATGPHPSIPFGDRLLVFYSDSALSIKDGGVGHYWHNFTPGADPTLLSTNLTHGKLGKYDLKVDDGRPHTGSVVLPYHVTTAASTYDPNSTTVGYMAARSEF